jgi:hypothetical protein
MRRSSAGRFRSLQTELASEDMATCGVWCPSMIVEGCMGGRGVWWKLVEEDHAEGVEDQVNGVN